MPYIKQIKITKHQLIIIQDNVQMKTMVIYSDGLFDLAGLGETRCTYDFYNTVFKHFNINKLHTCNVRMYYGFEFNLSYVRFEFQFMWQHRPLLSV